MLARRIAAAFARLAAGIVRLVAGLLALVPSLLRDLAGLAGVGLIAYGAWLIHPPYGFITGGVLLVVGAILISASRPQG